MAPRPTPPSAFRINGLRVPSGSVEGEANGWPHWIRHPMREGEVCDRAAVCGGGVPGLTQRLGGRGAREHFEVGRWGREEEGERSRRTSEPMSSELVARVPLVPFGNRCSVCQFRATGYYRSRW